MVGTTILHYRIQAKLGEGGMGVVYKAVDVRLNRPVALKVLRPDVVSDAARRQRFVQEARAASALRRYVRMRRGRACHWGRGRRSSASAMRHRIGSPTRRKALAEHGVDRTLLRENLKLTTLERAANWGEELKRPR